MSKRLQVVLSDLEYKHVQRAARTRGISVAELVRQALSKACRGEPGKGVRKKLECIRLAARLEYPIADIGGVLQEIERGYDSGMSR